MKNGITLPALATEIKRQQDSARDFLVSTKSMHLSQTGGTMYVSSLEESFGMSGLAHTQLGSYLDIPSRYYERMREEDPFLLATNVNTWLHNDTPKQRMLRTLDGGVRAFLSDKYRRIDNADVAETVLPLIGQIDGMEVMSCEITETRMYIKAVNHRIETDVKIGDTVQSGLIITNSEVGMGSVSISPLIYRLVCTNGMVAQDTGAAVRKYHIGRQNTADYDYNIYSDATIEADNRALMMKIQDSVKAAMDQAVFARIVDQMREASEARIEPVTVPAVVELASSKFGITQNESEGVLGHLIGGGELSLYGLSNAVTRYAQDVGSYDRSTELEATGYKILTMSPKLWGAILSQARKEV